MLFCELLQFERVIWAKGGAFVPVTGLSLNSRTVGHGALFFCLRGAHHDGHDYAMDAYRRGCRHFVVERMLPLPPDASVLVCSSVRKKMAVLSSRYYREPTKGLFLVGVTGTKGKTTTSLMLRELLERCGIPTAYIGSSGVVFGRNRIATENTTPPSPDIYKYLRMILDSGIKTVVLEVSSQALAADRVFGALFSLGVFTNISRDHIGAYEHADMAEYRAAKMKLFTDFSPRQIVLNAEDPFSFDIMERWSGEECVLYGNGEGSLLKYRKIRQWRKEGRLWTSFYLDGVQGQHEIDLGFAGEHYILDFLAALTSASLISGLPYTDMLSYAPMLSVAGRCEAYAMPSGALTVIDYAHNGASLSAALRGLRPYATKRLLCLFGAVGERTKCRRTDMAVAAERYADFSVITADNPGREDVCTITQEIMAGFADRERCCCIPDREEAIRYLLSLAGEGDVVLLAGKGDENYQLFAEGKGPFCEGKIIESCGGIRK